MYNLKFGFFLFFCLVDSLNDFRAFGSRFQLMAGRAPVGSTGYPNGVRIVVAGEAKTGKSSLIVATAAENFPPNVAPVLPPTRLPEDLFPDRVPVTIIDTSSRSSIFFFFWLTNYYYFFS